MKNIVIREAKKEDALNVTVLKKQVFISTYAVNGINSEFSSHITNHLTVENNEKSILDKDSITLLVEKDGFLIACAEILLKNTIRETKDNSAELGVLYVFEHMKGKGVGYLLISECESILKAKNYPGIWLTVYHQNKTAIEFYIRQSYKDIGRYDFEMEGKFYENRIMYKKF